MNITFTIIIPHKNCPDLLCRCFSSIPKRDDIEVIIVDDNSGLTIDDFQFIESDEYNSVYFLNQSKGAGFARNYGLSKAHGEWVLFADADDFFDTANLNLLMDHYKFVESVDIVYLNANQINEDGIIGPINVSSIIDKYIRNSSPKNELDLRYGMWSPWSRMVRRSLIWDNNILFEEIPIGNDTMFSLNCSLCSKKIEVFDSVVYYYFKPKGGSVTKKLYTEENFKGQLELALRVNNLYTKVGYPYKRSFFPFIILTLLDKKVDRKRRLSFIKDFYKQNRISYVLDFYNYLKLKLK